MAVDHGFHPPNSVTWKVNSESVLLLGGGRALLMQLAHPLVAQGVADHSDFQARPLRRLNRTMDLTLKLVFGTKSEAREAVRQINHAHQSVRGVLDGSRDPRTDEVTYSAMDPELLLWVHATLVDSALLAYGRYVAPLSDAECRAYYTESKLVGRLLGIPEDAFPADYAGFQDYVSSMIGGGPVVVGELARQLARSILAPPIPLLPPLVFAPLNIITTGLLPPVLRQGYRLAWGSRQQAVFALEERIIRRLVSRAPRLVRQVAPARAASRRYPVS